MTINASQCLARQNFVPKGKPLAQVLFAHGAGQGMDSDFMQQIARGLAANGIVVTTFNFPYMVSMLEQQKRRPPNPMAVLQQSMKEEIQRLEPDCPLVLVGKSMGGRVLTHLLDNSPAAAGICLGYPFHPPGKPERLRTDHLPGIAKPLLILQGQRDTFGNEAECAHYTLAGNTRIDFINDGEHSFKPRKASGLTWQDNILRATELMVDFIRARAIAPAPVREEQGC